MREWMERIKSNSLAELDFFNYLKDVEKTCFINMQQTLLKGQTEKALGLAYEARAYQALRDAYKGQKKNQRRILNLEE